MRIPLLRPIALAAALLVAPSAAQADWLAPFSGNGQFSLPATSADGVVNYAVYENTTGGDTFDQIFGAATPVTNLAGTVGDSYRDDRFVYVFQAINTKGPVGTDPLDLDADLRAFFVRIDEALVNGVGTVTGYVFNDAEGATGPGGIPGNIALGTVGPVPDPAIDGIAPGSGQAPNPGSSGVTNVGVTPSTVTGASRGNVAFNTDPPGTGLRFEFDGGLNTGEYTSLFFFTSNSSPAFRGGQLQDGGAALGDVPSPTPEPGTMALLALGLPVIGVRYIRRFRRGSAEATA